MMLFVLSPAKALDYETPLSQSLAVLALSEPPFMKASAALIKVLKAKKIGEIAELMDLSDKLASLNAARYSTWRQKAIPKDVRAAAFAFDGDVYDGLQARSMTASQIDYANDHLRILSGLYGVLKPLDALQAYRLEMGTALVTDKGKNLYEFWGDTITEKLNVDARAGGAQVLVNLASTEYFKSVKTKKLAVPVVECVFEQTSNGQYKVISFLAKKARGLMARYAVEKQVDQVEGLKSFNLEGYQFNRKVSSDVRLVFRKKHT